jgi:hypothetical protein
MKINVLIIAFLITYKTSIYSQDEKHYKFSIYFSSGIIQHTTNDPLLNFYNYSGNTIGPINLSGSFCNNKNFFILNYFYNKAKLNPDNMSNNYYIYNYIKHWDEELDLEYFRQIAKFNQYIQIYIGLRNSSYCTIQEENYKNVLYSNAEGIRKSYTVSAICLSPMLLFRFTLKKSNLIIKTGYSLLHYTARPDDNYVKQTGLNGPYHWSLYSVKTCKDFMLSIFYQYQLFNNFGVTAGYNISYRSFSSPDEYKYLRYSFLAGMFKTF